MTVWYTADLHLGHAWVTELRGHELILEHDAEIITQWRAQVHPRDVVYVLGDVAMGNRRDGLAVMANLSGRKRLIAGNHDACHPMHREAPTKMELYANAFEYVASAGRRRIDGQSVLLSHFPYSADRGEPRYMQWRFPDQGEWLLHGHTHSSVVRTGPREIHVGWDAWHRLVSEDEIADYLRSE